MSEAQVRLAERRDLPGIGAILEWSIREGWSNFETRGFVQSELDQRWEAQREAFPWLVAESGGEIAGAAWASPWKPKGAYAWTAEISVYVLPEHQGRGHARRLYDRLFPILERQGYRALLAGIALPNEPSVRLHESFDMKPVGTLEGVGYKMNAWRSVGYWQRRLPGADPPGPVRPVAEALAELDRPTA